MRGGVGWARAAGGSGAGRGGREGEGRAPPVHAAPGRGPSAREEPPPPPPLGVAWSPRFPSARLAWQPPLRRAPRPARGGSAPPPGPSAEPVGSASVCGPGALSPPAGGEEPEGQGRAGRGVPWGFQALRERGRGSQSGGGGERVGGGGRRLLATGN